MTLLEEAWLNELVFLTLAHTCHTVQSLTVLQKILGREVVYESLLHFGGESI